MGRVLDNFDERGSLRTGYIICYIVIFFFTVINFLSFKLMKEVPLLHSKKRIKISEIFTLPIKDKRFLRYFIMLVLYHLSIQIANAFYSVYLKSDLNLSYTVITTFSLLNSVFYVATARFWGKFADKNGWANTTMLTVAILALGHSLWFFANLGSSLLMVILSFAHILGGTAWSGINVSLFNLQFDFTPDEKRTVYIGFSAALSSITGFLAALLGAYLVGRFNKSQVMFLGGSYNIKQILFFVSSVLSFVCSIYIFLFMRPKKMNQNQT
jgi:MFS family permease